MMQICQRSCRVDQTFSIVMRSAEVVRVEVVPLRERSDGFGELPASTVGLLPLRTARR
jgi:hypothetical protein